MRSMVEKQEIRLTENAGNNIIHNMIHTIRGMHVMLDRDLALLYQVETKVLNQAVKRNIERFPETFRFQLSQYEIEELRSQFVTSKGRGGNRYLPYVFTQQGVAMLSAVLKSSVAIDISIKIMNAFVEMRHFISSKASVFNRLDLLELNQLENEQRFKTIFQALEGPNAIPKQGIFFDGQIFDAYKLVSDIIRSAKKSIILIDNYIDDTVLTLFTKRNCNIDLTIFTNNISKQLKLDLEKHNIQYDPIKIYEFDKAHDRFVIIDGEQVYHIGASLKDLSKKWFAFTKLNIDPALILDRIMRKA